MNTLVAAQLATDGAAAWYAAYTRSRHEKRVAEQLQRKSVEIFFPLYETVHQWKNGRARLRLPLFPGYVFVRIPYQKRLHVLEVPGVVYLAGSMGRATPIPDTEIDFLRHALDQKLRAEPHPYLTVGQRVRIRSGLLTGVEGVLVCKKQNFRVVISVDLIMRSIVVEVDGADVETIGSSMRAVASQSFHHGVA